MKSIVLKLWKDESGQGTAEYVLILVGIVVAAALFRNKLAGDDGILSKALDNVKNKIASFTSG